jgi:hypothetical protein
VSLTPTIRCFALAALLGAATCATETQAATLPSCTEVEAKLVTLRGTLSTVIDNAPAANYPAVVLDPSERIFVLTLKSPLCGNDPNSNDSPVTQLKVVTIEVLPGNSLPRSALQSRVGKVITIRGTLSKNPWWRYRAALLLTATEIG